MEIKMKNKGRIKDFLENTYIEILALYILLIFAIPLQILTSILIGVLRLPLIYPALREIATRVPGGEYFGRLFISSQAIPLFSFITILGVVLIIILIRIKKGVLLQSILFYDIYKNYNNSTVYKDLKAPITLAILSVLFFLFYYRFTFQNIILTITISLLILYLLSYAQQVNIIINNIQSIHDDKKEPKKNEFYMEFTKQALEMLENIDVHIQIAIDNEMKSERLKTELITNVSHDIKTPLTSIINYTDLLKGYGFNDDTVLSYIAVLERSSQRLKLLITDIVEASKTETGNIEFNLEKLELNELISQVYGEFDESFNEKNISFVFNPEDDVFVFGDGNYLGRVLENIIGNASKYTMENTRVYCEVKEEEDSVSFKLKNVSKEELNIEADELMERFIRGEKSRHTEGSGLGLYISKNLMQLMNGDLILKITGDLFEAKGIIPKQNKSL